MGKKIENVAVIGTGILGVQIAMVSVNAGYKTTVYDPLPNAFTVTYEKISADLKAKGVNPLIPWERWPICRDKIIQSSNLDEALKDADLVMEAVPENVELKKKVFAQLGEKTLSSAILASNSSSLPISRMETSSGRPEKCLNIHFYFPLQGMNMVDIMGGTRTDPEVMQVGYDWIISLGCVPLKVNKEILGFCFNNVWRAVKRQVLYTWANGFVDFRDVDRAWCIFTKMKQGPFSLMDMVGLDVVYDVEMSYYNDSKDPKDFPPDALLQMVKRGELGVKSGKGFYTYPNPEFLDPSFLAPWLSTKK